MQSMKRDWEKLSSKSLSNHNEILDNLEQIIHHLELIRQNANEDGPEKIEKALEQVLTESKTTSKSALQSHKEFHSLCSKWQKMIEKRFSQNVLPLLGTQSINPTSGSGVEDLKLSKRPFESHSARYALDRVIANHLIRQGRFETARIFIQETAHTIPTTELGSCELLYQILDSIRSGDLTPALIWAQRHHDWLEARGSSLEFDLHRSQFVHLLTDVDLASEAEEEVNEKDEIEMDIESVNDGTPTQAKPIPLPHINDHHHPQSTESKDCQPASVCSPSQQRALEYAGIHFRNFFPNRWDEAIRLISSVLYAPLPNLLRSPYSDFYQTADLGSQQPWVHAHHLVPLFTKEFYSNLKWSKELPLVVATDLGSGGALAKIAKVRSVMKEKRTEWSQADELPVEIPLPIDYRFHSVFACPVSKEQSTEANPPMMMPCGHVIAKESMQKLAKGGGTVKCPYCPSSASMNSAMQVYF
ncbi:hypothetical protein CROQUDRAFT_662344 [Cronartium quercuum f. sp. fusiforme G11]|uniref:GID complex catalytic subunit 2 n=1 Tax=Cronartium quercuum f. sp. fusiforme G11 TaxID=708437 RepID=A0A9P6T8I9_9BASI|nr:hypothetical protein CROQUDRAFT_662344 [Cronartium quercuum f. sp. fusiforme G11]